MARFERSASPVAHLPKLLGIIRKNPIHTELEELLHLADVVDRPHERLETRFRRALEGGRRRQLFLQVDRFGAELARKLERIFFHPRAVENADARIGGELADTPDYTMVERREDGALEIFVVAEDEKQLELHSQRALGVALDVDVQVGAPVDEIEDFFEREDPLAFEGLLKPRADVELFELLESLRADETARARRARE